MKYDVVVIGGGPAGMSAAIAAAKKGAKTVIVERNDKLGGILNQCIHNGFGLHYFGEELTGPEYAVRFIKLVKEQDIDLLCSTIVLDVDVSAKKLKIMNGDGVSYIEAKAIVLAMGCREKTAGAIMQCGYRPSGVFPAGCAQKMINQEGKMVGKKVVILGSGDIGLIMARRLTFEGAKVLMVLELMPYSSGLKRNIVQCLDDYGIPLYYSTTITKVLGKKRVEGVMIAKVDDKLKPIKETEKLIECDTVLLSVGLIPENDLISGKGIEMDGVTSGAACDEFRRTSADGIFACGNTLHVHDLADNASLEAVIAGTSAASYALSEKLPVCDVSVNGAGGVRYALPKKIAKGDGKVKVFFRVGNIYKDKKLVVKSGDEIIATKNALIFSPGEMESVDLDKSKISGDVTLALVDKEAK